MCPRRASDCSSFSTFTARATSYSSPLIVIWSPRTKRSASSWFSSTFKFSSLMPRIVCECAGSSSMIRVVGTGALFIFLHYFQQSTRYEIRASGLSFFEFNSVFPSNYQRPVEIPIAARAASPALAVRSTSGPSFTAKALASRNCRASSSEMPPSGPIMSRIF